MDWLIKRIKQLFQMTEEELHFTNHLVCEDCGRQEGIWMVYILKQYWKSFGKKYGLICTECLLQDLEGVRTGGGYNADHIKKIVRVTK